MDELEVLDPHAQADALAVALSAQGFVVSVYKSGGHQLHPCVEVGSGRWRLVETKDYVYVVPDDAGRHWFWWFRSWSPERIAPAEEVSFAADVIGRVIGQIPRRTVARRTTTIRAVRAV
jgi:hypothetical protein